MRILIFFANLIYCVQHSPRFLVPLRNRYVTYPLLQHHPALTSSLSHRYQNFSDLLNFNNLFKRTISLYSAHFKE